MIVVVVAVDDNAGCRSGHIGDRQAEICGGLGCQKGVKDQSPSPEIDDARVADGRPTICGDGGRDVFG
jgi:hypothetical protein